MKDPNRTVITPMQPVYRPYQHDLSQIMQSKNVFTPEECAQIIEMGDELEPGAIDGDKEVPEYRDSDIKWLAPNPDAFPFMDRLLQVVMQANQRFEFEMEMFESFQIARYKEGGHYNWHKDIGRGQAQYRKLSLSVQLSSPEDYDGGDLEMWVGHEQYVKCERDQGTVIVFPSWEQHRVTPITRGERWSLVTWACGGHRFR